ncbi:hypothetical protein QUF90_16895 [Desulfococcaceae bacterium HSG9]|nr:hypothetical protein [Desulfococcaceae bacterium HSG9]
MTTRKKIKNELGKEFTKKLMAYAATATGVMALTTGAEAGIVYSGVQNRPVSSGVSYNLDFDGGGTEFIFTQLTANTNSYRLRINGADGSDSWLETTGNYHAANLALNYTIQKSVAVGYAFGEKRALLATSYSGGSTYGNFIGKTGYIGVKFDCAAGTCYGWIQFTGAADVKSGIVVDWAYEDTGASIKAGNTGPVANNAPVADLNGSGTAGNDVSGSFIEGGGAVAIAPSGTVTDPDGDTIQTVTATLTNNLDGTGNGKWYGHCHPDRHGQHDQCRVHRRAPGHHIQ